MAERKPGEELKQALDHLSNAADAVVERVIGSKTADHLRQAAKHTLKAVRAALEEAERKLDEKSGGGNPP